MRNPFKSLGRDKQVLIGSALAFVVKLGSAVLSYLMFLLIARALGAKEYGAFSVGFALALTVGNIAGLGSGNAILRFLPAYIVQGKLGLAQGFITKIMLAVVTFSIGVGLLIAVAGWIWPANPLEISFALLCASAVLIPLTAYGDALSSFIRVKERMLLALIPRDILWRLIICTFTGATMAMTWATTARDIMWVCTISYGLVLLLQTSLAWNDIKSHMSGHKSENDTRHWIKTTLPFWGTISLTAMVQQFDVVMLGLVLSPADAGPYFAAQRTATLLTLFQLAASLAGAPIIAKYHAIGDIEKMRRTARLLALGISVPAAFGFLFMLIVGNTMLGLFDPTFVSAYLVLIILSLAFAFDAAAGPTAYLLQMTGAQGDYLKLMAASYALVICAQWLLIPHFGLLGAAIPNAVGLAVTSLIAVFLVRKRLGFDPSIFGLVAHFFARARSR